MKSVVASLPPFSGPSRPALPAFGVIAGIAVLLVLAFAAQLVFATAMDWPTALRAALHHWLVPFLVFGFGWGVGRFFPLERGRLRWTIPVYLAAAVLVVGLAGRVEQGMFPHPSAARGFAPLRHGPLPNVDRPPLRSQDLAQMPAGHGRRAGAGPRHHVLALLASSRWQLHLAVFAVSMSLTQAWRLYQRVQERDRRTLELTASLSQAKLEALRLQLQPHFLFNTLNAISTLVHRDAAAADEMISDLSELLRLSLEVGEQEVPLRRELAILDRYLAIEQVRLGARLRVERQIEPATLDGLVPSLVLQPVVENAIRHGLEPRAAAGTITVRAELVDETLRLVVTDDGPGLKPIDARTERRGIGLANTEARLRELYGEAGRLSLHEPSAGGLAVEIALPFHRR